MSYLVYKITNKINNKFYIGVHKSIINDWYMGSGVLIRKAIKRYGRKNFVKEILFKFDTPIAAYKKEAELVNEETLINPLCYNLIKGGGIRSLTTEEKISKALEGRKHKQESIEKRRLQQIGRKRSKESIRKQQETRKHNGTTPHKWTKQERMQQSQKLKSRSQKYNQKRVQYNDCVFDSCLTMAKHFSKSPAWVSLQLKKGIATRLY